VKIKRCNFYYLTVYDYSTDLSGTKDELLTYKQQSNHSYIGTSDVIFLEKYFSGNFPSAGKI